MVDSQDYENQVQHLKSLPQYSVGVQEYELANMQYAVGNI